MTGATAASAAACSNAEAGQPSKSFDPCEARGFDQSVSMVSNVEIFLVQRKDKKRVKLEFKRD